MGEALLVRRGTLPPPHSGNDIPYYWEGGEFETITGGWVEGDSRESGTQSKESDHLYLKASGTNGRRTWATDNLVDISTIAKLYVKVTTRHESSNHRYQFGVGTERVIGGSTVALETIENQNLDKSTLSLDVSGISDNLYIILTSTQGSPSSGDNESETYKVWGEE